MTKNCKLKYCINDCHVMSCHVMSCHVAIIVSTVIKIFSKLFYQLKISLNILRESLLALLQLKNCHYEDLKKSEVIYSKVDCFTPFAMTKKVKVAMTNAMTKKVKVAMTKVFAMIKIFNSINIGDCSLKMNCSLMNYSPLFIKKIY